jgi:signal transduction histidine kinase
MGRQAAAVAISALGAAAGGFSLDVARDDPSRWFAGTSTVAGLSFLGAGWALIGVGLAFWLRRPGNRFGPLLAAAGFAWFLLEWNNPGVGSALVFTVGLCLYAACPPLAGHAVLAYPGGRLGSGLERLAVATAYAGGLLVLGILPALFFDPQAQGCKQCPRNLLAVSDGAGLWTDLNRLGLYGGIAWALALTVLAGRRLRRASSWARPVFAAGAVYLGLVAIWFAASLDHGLLWNGTLETRLWFAQAAALVVLATGVAWNWVRNRRARSTVAQLIVDLAKSPPPGGLRDILAGTVGDPHLVLAYPLGTTNRLVDALGRPVELDLRQVQTRLTQDGRAVAVLSHAPGLLDDEQLVENVATAARLALENERLQAEVQARLVELRASRARIVEAGDAERKRLERDLHDGAQQRLVGLSLSLRLARSQLATDAAPDAVARLDGAEAELREAIVDLRELAHGIFPAVLADEGLAAAVEALAEAGRVPVRIRSLPEGRFALRVETAAYTVVAEAVRATTSGVVVEATRSGDALLVDVEALDESGLDVIALLDRLGALDGRLAVERREDGYVTLRAELPCES